MVFEKKWRNVNVTEHQLQIAWFGDMICRLFINYIYGIL